MGRAGQVSQNNTTSMGARRPWVGWGVGADAYLNQYNRRNPEIRCSMSPIGNPRRNPHHTFAMAGDSASGVAWCGVSWCGVVWCTHQRRVARPPVRNDRWICVQDL